MRKHFGQAAWFMARRLHNIAAFALGLAVLVGVALGGLAWRLSQGPLEVPWLLDQLEAAARSDTGPVHWSIGRASIAWEGFSAGVDQPLDIRLDDVAVNTAEGLTVARLPLVLASLSIGDLLAGRIVVQSAELRGASLRVVREADGSINAEFSGQAPNARGARSLLPDILAQLAEPIGSAGKGIAAPLRQLDHVTLREGSLRIVDRALGTEWPVPSVSMEVRRRPAGGVDADADVEVLLGSQSIKTSLRAELREPGQDIGVQVKLGPLNPSRLAADVAAFARLAAVDVPVTIDATLSLGTDFALHTSEARVQFGAGQVAVGSSLLPLAGGSATVLPSADGVVVKDIAVALAPKAGGVSKVSGRLSLRHWNGRAWLELTLDADRVDAMALSELWPDGIRTTLAKAWVVENITSGIAEDIHLAVTAAASENFSDLRVTSLTGGLNARNLTVHWLRPVPPLEHGVARFEITSPDAFEATILSARQGAIALSAGGMRITGLSVKDQLLDVDAEFAAPLADVIALLRQPKLHVLDGRPIEMRNPSGQVHAKVEIIRLPLEVHIDDSDIHIQTAAKLTGVRLGGIAAGQDLEQGMLDLTATSDGLTVQGSAKIAGIPAKLALTMDFRPDLPATVARQTATLSGTTDMRQIAALGLDLSDVLTGPVTGELIWRAQKDGKGEVSVKADLSGTEMVLPTLNFAKHAGHPAQTEFHLQLDKDRVAAIDRLKVAGEGIDLDAQVDFSSGRPIVARVQRAVIGLTDVRGEVRWPTAAGGPWQATLNGPSFDASVHFQRRDGTGGKPRREATTPPYVIDAKFGRVVLGEGRTLYQMSVRAESTGKHLRQARLAGRTESPTGTFEISIDPAGNARQMKGRALDAGGLLQALGVEQDMRGGEMTLSGTYDDSKPESPLAGRAEIADFRMIKAPGLAKLLQAMTLYGLMEMVQGPGLGFSKLEVPFTLADDVLDLEDARAFNASLGMTAQGRIDLATNRCDFEGTLVPAYFFNSLLGDLPIIGKLFSPERGGGLFAATYSLRGNCADPAVTVNPLAALTPGFLRGLFGLFDSAGKPADVGIGVRTPGTTR